MVSARVVRVVEQVNAAMGLGPRPSMEEIRVAVDRMWPEPLADAQIEESVVGGVPGRWITAPGAGEGVVVHLHGGGFAHGSSVSHRNLAARISRASASRVFVPDFSLSPENVFPRALDDAVGVVDDLMGTGPTTVFLSGDSAGGGLAVSTTLRLIADGRGAPAGVIVMSPWVDLTLESESFGRNADIDPMGDPRAYAALARGYLQGHDPRDPLVSPCFADLTGFPPLLVQAGSSELIVDDAIRLAAAARRAGGIIDLQIYPQMCHAFQLFDELAESVEALGEVGRFVRQWSMARRKGGREQDSASCIENDKVQSLC